jgi:hypothetical protein
MTSDILEASHNSRANACSCFTTSRSLSKAKKNGALENEHVHTRPNAFDLLIKGPREESAAGMMLLLKTPIEKKSWTLSLLSLHIATPPPTLEATVTH